MFAGLEGSDLAGARVARARVARVCERILATTFGRPEPVILRLAAEVVVWVVVHAANTACAVMHDSMKQGENGDERNAS